VPEALNHRRSIPRDTVRAQNVTMSSGSLAGCWRSAGKTFGVKAGTH